jgi:hypothetical protein
MVLSSEHCVVQHLYTPLESVKRSPPQELKLHLATVEAIDLEKKKINLPTITIIESSPIREYSTQQKFATKLAQATVLSDTTDELSECQPLPSYHSDKVNPTIEALIKATKATFNKEELNSRLKCLPHSDDLLQTGPELLQTGPQLLQTGPQLLASGPQTQEDHVSSVEDSNNNASCKPKPSDLPPLKTLTITCPSSPLLQRHALLQAQKEAESNGVKISSPPIPRRNTAKRSPPLFRTSLTEIENKSRTADGSVGSLSPKLSRRYSGQGSSLLELQAKSTSLDKDGSVSPILSSETSSTKSDKIDELENSAMEVDEKSVGSRNSITDLDMTVRSGMIDSMNVRKPEVKKNVTFSLDIDEQSSSSDVVKKEEVDVDMSRLSGESSVKTKSKASGQSKPVVKEGKKKGPLGIVMGKAAIAARAVSNSAQRSVSTSSLPSSRKQQVASSKSVLKSETTPYRKHSHSQCVMGTSAAHTSRVGHVSCATCGRRRAASQSNVSSEPPTKQQAKGKQAPVRKTSVESYPRKSAEAGQTKNVSPREESQKSSKNSSGKKERKPFFV